MNKEEILAMNPSIELGNLVAIEVMEWRREGDHWVTPEGFWVNADGLHGWHPWQDISAAWRVVEKMRENITEDGRFTNQWLAFVRAFGEFYIEQLMRVITPETICKAALIAIHSGNNV